MRSMVARAVDAQVYHARPSLSSMHVSNWSGLPVRGAEWWIRPGYSLLLFPAGEGFTTLVMSTAIAEYPRIRSDVDRAASEAASAVPDLRERLAAGRREDRWTGTADLPNFLRRPHGKGWALVGDAGYHKDPLTAQGITDALHSAQFLADALDAAFSGRLDAGLALDDYERSRNSAVRAMYEFTCERAAHGPLTPGMVQLLSALASNPEHASKFVGLLAGTSRWEEFFHPENIGQILPGAASHPLHLIQNEANFDPTPVVSTGQPSRNPGISTAATGGHLP
jgi:2-polyprenyl-6-methoxyphenol hydroxylase-like FAD-dependent oxidoreductase